MTIGGLVKQALSTGTATAVATMVALTLAPTGAAAAACAKQFKKCCTINAPGTYTFAGYIFPPPTAPVCIDIIASDVILGAGPELTGPGAGTPTVGIDIEASAKRVVVHRFTVANFGQGIHIDGSNATIYNVYIAGNQRGIVVNGANALITSGQAYANGVGIQINKTATHFVLWGVNPVQGGGNGIELNGVSGAFVSAFESAENKAFGIWLNGASNNFISEFSTWDNGIAGVYLGCNPAGPDGNASCSSDASSDGNFMLSDRLFFGDSTVGIGASALQNYGIAVGLGSLLNVVLAINGDGNLVDDALDENPNCANNRWLGNTFTISNPAQNTTDYCIN